MGFINQQTSLGGPTLYQIGVWLLVPNGKLGQLFGMVYGTVEYFFGSLFSPNMSTLGGSYGSCKGRCLIRVLTLRRCILPLNFRIKWLLSNFDMRFDCAGLYKVGVCILGRGIFPVNFRIKWLL